MQTTVVKLLTLAPGDLLSFHIRFPLVHTVVVTAKDLTYQQVEQISRLPHLERIEFRQTGLAQWNRSPDACADGIRKQSALAHLTQVSSLKPLSQ